MAEENISKQKHLPFPFAKNVLKSDTKQAAQVKSKPVSLSNFIKGYNYSYSDTYVATLAALTSSNVELISYNSSKGTIKAKLSGGKMLYIVLIYSQPKSTQVRITPADGVYDLPDTLIEQIFGNIKLELAENKS